MSLLRVDGLSKSFWGMPAIQNVDLMIEGDERRRPRLPIVFPASHAGRLTLLPSLQLTSR
jgi:ABC-type branched-subunit amino acid transport system ATPase component